MYCDYRLTPRGEWYFEEPKGSHLRLPDYVKTTVCFLCVESKGRTLYGGTAFFTDLDSEKHPELYFSYLVTAKHCVLKAYEKFGHLKARINQMHGSGAIPIDLPQKWVYSKDPAVDVAVLPIDVGKEFDVNCLPSKFFVSQQNLERFGIGIGDETTTIGLFTQRYGKKLNIPILRSGIIAAMPEEALFDTKTAAEFHAYLIEARSIGGLSGSPVFVSIPPHRAPEHTKERPCDGYSIPLGLVRGHWEIDITPDDSLEDFMNDGKMNTGIAMVTPIQEVTKILMENEELKKLREGREKAFEEGTLMIEDTSFEANNPEPTFTKEDFVDALKKVSKKIEPKK